jgi:transposase-like protein
MARSKYSKDVSEKICALVSQGNYQKVAAACVGISEDTFYKWIKRYPEFAESLKKADALAEAKRVQTILKAGNESWQAAAWYLERKHADRWGRQDRADQTDDETPPPVKVEVVVKDARKHDTGSNTIPN